MCSVLLCRWVLDRASQRLESWVLHLLRVCLIQHTDFPGWAHRSGVKGWTCCRWSWALLPATCSHSAATADSGQATGHAGGTLFFGTLIASLMPGLLSADGGIQAQLKLSAGALDRLQCSVWQIIQHSDPQC